MLKEKICYLSKSKNIRWKVVVYFKNKYDYLLKGDADEVLDAITPFENICNLKILKATICGQYYLIHVLEEK